MSREQVREEFLSLLREQAPDLQVESMSEDEVVLLSSGSEWQQLTLRFHRMYGRVERLEQNTAEARRAVYQDFINTIPPREPAGDVGPLTLEIARSRVLPRLLTDEYYEAIQSESHGQPLPQRPLDRTGLRIVYVLDAPTTIQYLMRHNVDELGIAAEQLDALAFENARRLLDRETVRKLVEADAFSVLNCQDGHNAARALVIPEYLEPGEELLAFLPDRQMLILGPVPEGGVPHELSHFEFPTDDPYLPHPLRITWRGFEVP